MLILEGLHVPGLRNTEQILSVVVFWGLIVTFIGGRLGWPWPILGVIAAGFILALIGLRVYVAMRDQSGSRALVRWIATEDGIARFGRRVHRWREYTHVDVYDAIDGWRLQLHRSRSAWRIGRWVPHVIARLDCGEREAKAVRDELQNRIDAARGEDADAPEKKRAP